MPWTGTSRGPQAFLDNLDTTFMRWENQALNVTTMFRLGGERGRVQGLPLPVPLARRVVTSLFSILLKVVDGRVTYMQFLEDSYATASSSPRAAPGPFRRSPRPNRSRCDIQRVVALLW